MSRSPCQCTPNTDGMKAARQGVAARFDVAAVGESPIDGEYDVVVFSYFCFTHIRPAAARARALADVRALEKEKGITRMGFGAGLQLTKKDGLSLAWTQAGARSGVLRRAGVADSAVALLLVAVLQTGRYVMVAANHIPVNFTRGPS